jgi:hypothetical protein
MASIARYEEENGQHVGSVVTGIQRYRYDDGTFGPVTTQSAWCKRCQRFAAAENLIDPAILETHAREHFDHRGANPLVPDEIISLARQDEMNRSLRDRFLSYAARWRDALSRRKSPPRCLECGSTDFTPLSHDDESLFDPRNPKKRLRCNFLLVDSTRELIAYDTEGNRLKIKVPQGA